MKGYETLNEFVRELDREGELIRIAQPVSRDLEISEIYFRHARSPEGGRALLFENVEGSDIPLLINAFGSRRRMRIAFGHRHLDQVADEMRKLLEVIKMKPPSGIGDLANLAKIGGKIFRFPPKRMKHGKAPVQEVVWRGQEVDLDRLPILKSWPLDGGRFITMGLTVTQSLHTGSSNLGMYRLQQMGKRSLAMHWQIHKDGSHFWQEYRKAGKRMPVSVVIGGDPATVYSATAPMPPNFNELLLAGFLRGRGVSVVQGVTNHLLVPAQGDIVLEGYVDPDDLIEEGPFGDHTGYYTPVEPFPLFHVEAITMRKNPIYLATVVGRSPQEDCYLAEATERIFLPMLQVVAPEVTDQMLPWDGNFHNCAVFSMRKEFPFHARRMMHHLWGFSQMSFARSLVFVDESVNLHTGEALLRHILNSIHVVRDITISDGILDQLDHSGIRPLFGGKLGLDATTKSSDELVFNHSNNDPSLIQEPARRKLPASHSEEKLKVELAACLSLVKKGRWSVKDHHLYGKDLLNPVWILSVHKKISQGDAAKRIGELLKPERRNLFPARVIVLLPGDDDPRNGSKTLWRVFGNVDPLRDVSIRINESDRGRDVVIIDATPKGRADGYNREWPLENLMDPDTIERVDKRWSDLFDQKPYEVERP